MLSTGERRVTLGARTILGRSPGATIRVTHARVSGEHACLYWNDDRWYVRDLGSTNGTWVNGDLLPSGARRELETGDRILLGGAEAFGLSLLQDGPPDASATSAVSGARTLATNGLLHLPDTENPALAVYYDGGWIAEVDGEQVRVDDQDTVDVGGTLYRLELPPGSEADGLITTETAGSKLVPLDACHLRFRVSRDEEHVELTVVHSDDARAVASRAFHYTLLTLARQRVGDAKRRASSADQGWVYADELARMLGSTKPRVNLDIHRLRQQLAECGIAGAGRIVERRATAQQLRIGVASLEILSLDE